MQAKNKADYKESVIYNRSLLFLILCLFHSNKLEMLYFISLLIFFACFGKDRNFFLKNAFDNAYNNHKLRFICIIINLVNTWIILLTSNLYFLQLVKSKFVNIKYK